MYEKVDCPMKMNMESFDASPPCVIPSMTGSCYAETS